MSECSNHNGTTTTPLADSITGFNSRTLKSCPFCGAKTVELVLFDDEGYLITEEFWDDVSRICTRMDKDSKKHHEYLIEWAQKNYEAYVEGYGVRCFNCNATIVGQDPDTVKNNWNRRAYPINEWKSAFAPSEGIQ